MNQEEVNQKYSALCAEIGHLAANREKIGARINQLLAAIAELDAQNEARIRLEQEVAAKLEEKAKATKSATSEASKEVMEKHAATFQKLADSGD